uniref:F-box domain-containing protein n=1 Tax=Mycena chlorophos TaxID=658473 RepID=A0ABQ0LEC3_MYCCL|nr:predicted protein [Mycena chlorophos]
MPPRKKARVEQTSGPNLPQELRAQFTGTYKMLMAAGDFAQISGIVHAPASESKIAGVERIWLAAIWLAAFTAIRGSPEAAQATLAEGVEPPSLAEIKFVIWFAATQGHSNVEGSELDAWSRATTLSFLVVINMMLKSHKVKALTEVQTTELHHAIDSWVKEDGVLPSSAREKKLVFEPQINEILAATWHKTTPIVRNYTRVSLTTLVLFLFTHGTRIGTILVHKDYKAEEQCLRWTDIEFTIIGWVDGVGPTIMVKIKFHWSKGARSDESIVFTATSRTLAREKLHLDYIPPMLATAVYAGLFRPTDVAFIAGQAKPTSYPYRLHQNEAVSKLPVWTYATKPNSSMTADYFGKFLRLISIRLGWEGLKSSTFRYSFAAVMSANLPEVFFKYTMMHSNKSFLGWSTYQAPDREVDAIAKRFDVAGTDFAQRAMHHSCISWNRTVYPAEYMPQADANLDFLREKFNGAFTAAQNALDQDLQTENINTLLHDDTLPADAIQKIHQVLDAAADLICYFTSTNPDPTPQDERPKLKPGFGKLLEMLNANEPMYFAHGTVVADAIKPNAALFAQYLNLINLDYELPRSVCILCYSDYLADPTIKKPSPQNENFAAHFRQCELEHAKNKYRCPFCNLLVDLCPPYTGLKPNRDGSLPEDPQQTFTEGYPLSEKLKAVQNDNLTVDERQFLTAAFRTHMDGCFGRWKTFLSAQDNNLDPTTGIEEALDEDDDRAPSRPATPMSADEDEGDAARKVPNNSPQPPSNVLQIQSTCPTPPGSRACQTVCRPHPLSIDGESDTGSVRSAECRRSFLKGIDDGGDAFRSLCGHPMCFPDRIGSNHAWTVSVEYTCIECLYDEQKNWFTRAKTHRKQRDARRHLFTHFGSGGVFDSDLTFSCPLDFCEDHGKVQSARDYFVHLHKRHGFLLLRCNRHCNKEPGKLCSLYNCKDHEDDHDDDCFTFVPTQSDNMLFHQDALVWADPSIDNRVRRNLPATTIIEDRTPAYITKRYKAILLQINGKLAKLGLPEVPIAQPENPYAGKRKTGDANQAITKARSAKASRPRDRHKSLAPITPSSPPPTSDTFDSVLTAQMQSLDVALHTKIAEGWVGGDKADVEKNLPKYAAAEIAEWSRDNPPLLQPAQTGLKLRSFAGWAKETVAQQAVLHRVHDCFVSLVDNHPKIFTPQLLPRYDHVLWYQLRLNFKYSETPIGRLGYDVHTEIFALIDPPYLLLQVCATWRRMALELKCLWSSLCISDLQDLGKVAFHTRLEIPLHLQLETNDEYVLDMLRLAQLHVTSLNFTGNFWDPAILKEFPSLTRLSVAASGDYLGSPSLSLTHITLHRLSLGPQQILDFLSPLSKHLQSLELVDCIVWEPFTGPQIVLAALQSLTLDDNALVLEQFCPFLVAPALRIVSITTDAAQSLAHVLAPLNPRPSHLLVQLHGSSKMIEEKGYRGGAVVHEVAHLRLRFKALDCSLTLTLRPTARIGPLDYSQVAGGLLHICNWSPLVSRLSFRLGCARRSDWMAVFQALPQLAHLSLTSHSPAHMGPLVAAILARSSPLSSIEFVHQTFPFAPVQLAEMRAQYGDIETKITGGGFYYIWK